MRRHLLPLILGLVVVMTGFATSNSFAQQARAKYMSLENCPVHEQPTNQDEDWIILRCAGYGDVGFLLMYGDAREWPKLYRYGWERDFYSEVMSQARGHFPGFGSKVVEFRYRQANRPHALIFRINSDNPDTAGHFSDLFVARLGNTPNETCIIGVVRSNQQAAALADSNARCY